MEWTYWLSKLAWQVVAPDMVLLYLVLLVWVLLLRGYVRAGKYIIGAVAVLMLLVTFVPLADWILYPLERIFPFNPALPDKVDGIVVLAGPEDSGRGAVRYAAFQALARKYPRAKLVSTNQGGNLLTERYSEALAKDLSVQQGFDVSRILFETKARNTYDNAVLSKALARPAPGENWVLVTSAFHMPRSIGVFCKAGWPVIAYPVELLTMPGKLLNFYPDLERHRAYLHLGIKEWVGLLGYYLTGRTTSLLPRSCN